MKATVYKTFLLILMVYISGKSNCLFAQCTATQLMSENFNSFSGGATTQADITTYLTAGGQTAGNYANKVGGITDDVQSISPGGWFKRKASNCATSGINPVTNTGGTIALCTDCNNYTGVTGANGDKAYFIDGDGSNTNGQTVWCYTASGTYAAGTIFKIEAKYASPWCTNNAGGNNPTMWYSVGGTTVTGTTVTVTQYSGSATSPYVTHLCYYTVPAGGLTAPQICINICQMGGSGGGLSTCKGAATGNDLLIDDIVISTISGATCVASGCTVTPLPVGLISFSADKTSQNIILKWSTASESNNDYFTVEKSKNGIDFTTVEIVDGAGNSQSTLNYQTTDYLPYNGITYYRLKQTDFDGKVSYSKIVAVNFNGDGNITIYPNPGTGIFSIQGLGTESEITVHNPLGQTVLIKRTFSDSSEIDLSNQPSGVYFIMVNDGDTSINAKIILNRQ